MTVAASGIAFLDSTAVAVALPSIGEDLGAGVGGLQWVIDGYLLTLAALILLGGALGDRFGRRRIFTGGVLTFSAAFALCAAAPSVEMLVAARLAQGIGGALLTPNSLAILQATIAAEDRSRAIGAWTGLSGVAAAIGPLLGGWLTDTITWRAVFLLNLPLTAIVVVGVRHAVPESSDTDSPHTVDVPGSVLLVGALGAIAWGLIESGGRAGISGAPLTALVLGGLALWAFVAVERRRAEPMVPLRIFAEPQFRAINTATLFVYAALGSVMFLLVVHLQIVLGYSALRAGAATAPITALMLLLSPGSGSLAQRIGPRPQMTAGPLIMAAAAYLLGRIDPGDGYLSAVLPAVALFGMGLAATVAPLTAAALAAVPERHAGVASGVNTAIARSAQLAAVAAIPVVTGISGDVLADPAAFDNGFRRAMEITSGLTALGGAVSFGFVRNPLPRS